MENPTSLAAHEIKGISIKWGFFLVGCIVYPKLCLATLFAD